jgi:Icc-related predicted phosphoesterase
MAPRLYLNEMLTSRPIDILIAHSPPYGIHNGKDRTHVGFKSFLWLMRQFRPRYLIHGHRHIHNPLETAETQYEQTTVINVYPYKLLEIDVEPA